MSEPVCCFPYPAPAPLKKEEYLRRCWPGPDGRSKCIWLEGGCCWSPDPANPRYGHAAGRPYREPLTSISPEMLICADTLRACREQPQMRAAWNRNNLPCETATEAWCNGETEIELIQSLDESPCVRPPYDEEDEEEWTS